MVGCDGGRGGLCGFDLWFFQEQPVSRGAGLQSGRFVVIAAFPGAGPRLPGKFGTRLPCRAVRVAFPGGGQTTGGVATYGYRFDCWHRSGECDGLDFEPLDRSSK